MERGRCLPASKIGAPAGKLFIDELVERNHTQIVCENRQKCEFFAYNLGLPRATWTALWNPTVACIEAALSVLERHIEFVSRVSRSLGVTSRESLKASTPVRIRFGAPINFLLVPQGRRCHRFIKSRYPVGNTNL